LCAATKTVSISIDCPDKTGLAEVLTAAALKNLAEGGPVVDEGDR
jgi:hypothetical protein